MKNYLVVCACLILLIGCSANSARREAATYDMAAKAYTDGDLSKAEGQYQRIVEQHPEFVDGWFKLGNIYVRMGQYDAAANMYKKAAQINPEDAKIWNNLAIAYIKKSIAVLDEGATHLSDSKVEKRSIVELRERIAHSVLKEE
jgi:tetratricopeptide (TPR) repeat protein